MSAHHKNRSHENQDIVARQQTQQRLASRRLLEIEAQRALVAVDGGEAPRERDGLAPFASDGDQRRKHPHIVADVWIFDLVDARAEVGEDQGTERSGEEA